MDLNPDAIAKGVEAAQADAIAGSSTFMKVAVMPVILVVVFLIVYLVKKKDYVASKKEPLNPVAEL